MQFDYGNMLPIAVLVTAITTTTACNVEIGGEREVLSFHYSNSSRMTDDFDGAVAVGASVDMYVTRHDASSIGVNSGHLPLQETYSQDAQTLGVGDVGDTVFRLDAHRESGPEGTEIHAVADPGNDGEPLEDFITIRTAEIDRIEIDTCPNYIGGQTVQADYRMKDADDRLLAGYGVYPFSFEPEGAAVLVDDHDVLGAIEFELDSEPGGVEIVSELNALLHPDLVDSTIAEFNVITPDDIDEVEGRLGEILAAENGDQEITDEPEHVDSSHLSVREESSELLEVFGLYHDGAEVCAPATDIFELSTDDPDVCQPEYTPFRNAHWVMVRGLETGTCEVEVAVPSADYEQSWQVHVGDVLIAHPG